MQTLFVIALIALVAIIFALAISATAKSQDPVIETYTDQQEEKDVYKSESFFVEVGDSPIEDLFTYKETAEDLGVTEEEFEALVKRQLSHTVSSKPKMPVTLQFNKEKYNKVLSLTRGSGDIFPQRRRKSKERQYIDIAEVVADGLVNNGDRRKRRGKMTFTSRRQRKPLKLLY